MNNKKYSELALLTELQDYNKASNVLKDEVKQRLLHAVLGIGTEAGELQDALKKHVFYSQPLDTTNVIEEVGDLLWYINLLLDVIKVPIEDIMALNINKLKARYGSVFTPIKATKRDLKKERKVLEKK